MADTAAEGTTFWSPAVTMPVPPMGRLVFSDLPNLVIVGLSDSNGSQRAHEREREREREGWEKRGRGGNREGRERRE